MNVYIVITDWHNDQAKIERVFDSRKKAEMYFAKLLKEMVGENFPDDDENSFEECVKEGTYKNSCDSNFMYIEEYAVN